MGLEIEALKNDIKSLLQKYSRGSEQQQELLNEFILSTLLYNWEDPEPDEIIPLKEGLDEIRKSITMFKKYKYDTKISIFGSARVAADNALYRITSEFAQKAAYNNYKIITGAGPGIMEAGNVGAGPENSFGLGLNLPFENDSGVFADFPEHITVFKHFYSRKLTFYRESQAIVVMPGGFGTMDEIFQGMASIQTGKLHVRPFLLMDKPGGIFWNNFDIWLKENLLKNEYIDNDDMLIYRIFYNADDTLNYIKHFYHNFFSYFMLEDRLFFQLKIKLKDAQLKELNDYARQYLFSEFIFVRERYYNNGALYVYSCQKLNLYQYINVIKLIEMINNF